ncbi:hypothetical protein [Nannocystis pusilla]|uniref:hypothetical protein n=1 Tax=Nannocystis pusilla TaxID=889268 RepID=UPI003B7DE345
MEWIEGATLRAWLRLRARGWREIVTVVVAAGRGLAAAHAAGLLHRDFKPENILIDRRAGHAWPTSASRVRSARRRPRGFTSRITPSGPLPAGSPGPLRTSPPS